MATDENINNYSRLEELSESNFEIVDGQPNIQGWDIESSKGVKIGEVDDLLFDPESRKVRYIVLDTENNDLDLEDGHVLIPIGVAELNEKDDTVLIPNITVEQLTSLPLYERGREISREIEAEIRNVFIKPDTTIVTDNDFYEHEHFNETKFYGKRKPITAEDRLITEGGDHLLTEGGDHLLTEGEREVPAPDSAEKQKYNRDNIIP
ncbi:PRC-barrel domain-containing protein [Mucilaginibacter sp.]|jgi:sporulation protein YlmC with PRC-barrel domain|uniref:PRC-barrel domain-containing protein n=1 Tax=Mucilaginibacter sp. TaxID=1882438 RepID=UPI00356A33D4